MTDYLYKFPDEATAQSVLADYYNPEMGWVVAGNGWALDPIGVFVDVDATDPENAVTTPLDGWHLNLRITDERPNPAPEYSVTPNHQRRKWL